MAAEQRQEGQPAKEAAPERRAPCLVTIFIGDQTRRGSSIHFNERGILVLCQEPAPLGTKLKLILQFPGLRNPIELQGEVVWTNIHGPADSMSPRGMGVKFAGAERDTERLLADLSGQYEGTGVSYACYFT